MYRKKKKLFFAFPLLVIAAILICGFMVMLLWNFIFPSVLHAEHITYWQAVGLFVLCRILFSGFRRRYGGKPGMWGGSESPWRRKWMNMSDEERAKFREEWKKRHHSPDDAQ